MRGGCTLSVIHGLCRMTEDSRIPTMSGRSTSDFHPQGRHGAGERGGGVVFIVASKRFSAAAAVYSGFLTHSLLSGFGLVEKAH